MSLFSRLNCLIRGHDWEDDRLGPKAVDWDEFFLNKINIYNRICVSCNKADMLADRTLASQEARAKLAEAALAKLRKKNE